MREALAHVHNNVPFFSAGHLMHAEGVPYPEALGGNCVTQAHALIDQLRQREIKAKVLKEIRTGEKNGKHRGHRLVVASENGRDFLLDPVLYHNDPIDLTSIIESGEQLIQSPDADPADKLDQIRITPISDSLFRVELVDYYALDSPGQNARRTNMYDLNSEHDLPALSDLEAARLDLNSVVIELRHPETKEILRVMLETMMKTMFARVLTGKTHMQGTRGFNLLLDEIAEITGVDKKDILDTMLTARRTYQEVFGVKAQILRALRLKK